MIERVEQKHLSGCGAACIAMVTGKSYDEVAEELPAHSWHSDGISEDLLDCILAGWGYAVARRYVGHGAAWWVEPFGDVHICLVNPGIPHWVVMLRDGRVLDPGKGMDGDYRITDYPLIYSIAAIVPIPGYHDVLGQR